MKLGTLLLRNAAIGLSQLEAALRNQVLYGGRLGTNLVELGYIDLELLSAYLAELSGYPIATPTLLDQADPALLEKLGFRLWHPLLEKRNDDGALTVLSGLRDFREHLGGELTITLLREVGVGEEVHEMNEGEIRKAIAWLKHRLERR